MCFKAKVKRDPPGDCESYRLLESLVKLLVLTLFVALSAAPFEVGNPASDSFGAVAQDAAVEKHICEVVPSLTSGSGVRAALEKGARGGGVHYPWMDEMKREGVKRALVEIHFVWRGRPKQMRVVRTIYFKEYQADCAQITDAARIDQIRASGLEEKLQRFALQRTEGSTWFFEKPRHSRGLRGVSYVDLLDDERLPCPPPVLQPFDPRRSFLDQAALLGDELDVARLLAEGGIGPTELNGALMAAASGRNACVVKLLVKAGVDVNSESKEGRTPLMNAAGSAKLENVKAMLEAGANPNARDRFGRTALSLAERQGYTEIVELLRQAGAKE